MFDQAQLRKGTLEGCILKIIDREPTYGYAIATTLRDSGFADLTEGTLYPLLLRLERKGLIAAEYRAGSGGPSRKYYRLTPRGHEALKAQGAEWETFARSMDQLLNEAVNHDTINAGAPDAVLALTAKTGDASDKGAE